jgi:MSHA pilin protein MshA
MSREKGFTLIEIVMVIILLGILAAVAIPRFIDMSGEAKKSAVKGVLGGVRGAISIAYANNALRGHAGYPTMANLTSVSGGIMTEGIPDNPFAATTQTDKNDVESTTAAKGTKTADADKEWRYNPNTGQFWSAVGGGVGANGF